MALAGRKGKASFASSKVRPLFGEVVSTRMESRCTRHEGRDVPSEIMFVEEILLACKKFEFLVIRILKDCRRRVVANDGVDSEQRPQVVAVSPGAIPAGNATLVWLSSSTDFEHPASEIHQIKGIELSKSISRCPIENWSNFQ